MLLLLMLYSLGLLMQATFEGQPIGAWVWDRHQNQFSWYSRPLFVVPACYYAYRRKPVYVAAILVLMFASLFWFPAPATVPPHISGYLDWEQRLFFSNTNRTPLVLMSVTVLVFLWLLLAAFWHRNLWIGLGVLNIGTCLKVLVSVLLDPVTGEAAILPSITSLIVLNGLAAGVWYRRRGQSES